MEAEKAAMVRVRATLARLRAGLGLSAGWTGDGDDPGRSGRVAAYEARAAAGLPLFDGGES